MSFDTHAPSPGVLTAREVDLVRSVYDQVVTAEWFPKEDEELCREVAKLVLVMYHRGLTVPAKLHIICRWHAFRLVTNAVERGVR